MWALLIEVMSGHQYSLMGCLEMVSFTLQDSFYNASRIAEMVCIKFEGLALSSRVSLRSSGTQVQMMIVLFQADVSNSLRKQLLNSLLTVICSEISQSKPN